MSHPVPGLPSTGASFPVDGLYESPPMDQAAYFAVARLLAYVRRGDIKATADGQFAIDNLKAKFKELNGWDDAQLDGYLNLYDPEHRMKGIGDDLRETDRYLVAGGLKW